MNHIPHELDSDFPEHTARIAELRSADAEFAKLFAEYDEINRAVYKAEAEIAPTDDVHLEDLRKKRVWLKDQIYSRLTAQA